MFDLPDAAGAGVEVVHQSLHGVRLDALQVDGDGAHAGAAPLAGEQGGEVGGARHEDALVTRHGARLEHEVELKMDFMFRSTNTQISLYTYIFG